jgi:photosystem II stability/assembly factor-like uncharacterized protein
MDVGPGGVLWVTCEDGSLRFSNDVGKAWQTVKLTESGPAPGLSSISFDKNGVGVAVGQKGTVLATFDGGKSWRTTNLKVFDELWTVRVQSPYIAILDENQLRVFEVK